MCVYIWYTCIYSMYTGYVIIHVYSRLHILLHTLVPSISWWQTHRNTYQAALFFFMTFSCHFFIQTNPTSSSLEAAVCSLSCTQNGHIPGWDQWGISLSLLDGASGKVVTFLVKRESFCLSFSFFLSAWNVAMVAKPTAAILWAWGRKLLLRWLRSRVAGGWVGPSYLLWATNLWLLITREKNLFIC